MTTDSPSARRADATNPPPPPAKRASAFRTARGVIGKNPTADKVYRTSVGVVGGGVVALGVALIPLPGPGSLIAVGGLAILGTEFEGAAKVSRKANAVVKKGAAQVKKRRAARAAKKAADGS